MHSVASFECIDGESTRKSFGSIFVTSDARKEGHLIGSKMGGFHRHFHKQLLPIYGEIQCIDVEFIDANKQKRIAYGIAILIKADIDRYIGNWRDRRTGNFRCRRKSSSKNITNHTSRIIERITSACSLTRTWLVCHHRTAAPKCTFRSFLLRHSTSWVEAKCTTFYRLMSVVPLQY